MSGQREAGSDDVRLTARRLREVIRLMPLRLRVESADDLGVLAGVLEGLGVLTLSSLGPHPRIALTRLCDSVLAACSLTHTARDETARHEAFLELRQRVGEARHVVETLIENLSLQTSQTLRYAQLSADEQRRVVVEYETELRGVRQADLRVAKNAPLDATVTAEVASLYVTPSRPSSIQLPEPALVVPVGTLAAHLNSLHELEQIEHVAARRMWKHSMWLLWIALAAGIGLHWLKGGSADSIAIQLTVVVVLGLMSTRCLKEYYAHRREQLRYRYVRTLLEKSPVVASRIIELVGTSSPDPETTRRIVEDWMKEVPAADQVAAADGEDEAKVIGMIKEILDRFKPGKTAG